MKKLNTVNGHIKLSGGISGDILPKNIMGYILTAMKLWKTALPPFPYCNQHWLQFQTEYGGGILLKIEDKTETERCQEPFYMEKLTQYFNWPFIAENNAYPLSQLIGGRRCEGNLKLLSYSP